MDGKDLFDNQELLPIILTNQILDSCATEFKSITNEKVLKRCKQIRKAIQLDKC